MTFQEILSVGLAVSGGVEMIMEAVFEFSEEEVAGVDFAVDSQFGVGHQLFI